MLNTKLKPVVLAVAGVLAISANTFAADAIKTEKVEVVSATPLPSVGVPITQIPSNVQLVKAKELRDSQALDLSEYMNRNMSGVYINEIQGNPVMPDVNYRGFTASPLLGTPQGISVYLDGVRMNQPFGDAVNWDILPKNAIAGMQIMPGSNPLFGLNTLGGALSVQTKDGRNFPGGSAQFTFGSYGRKIGEFEYGGSKGDLDWYIAGAALDENGWRDHSPSNYRQLFGKLGWRGEKTDLKLTYAFADTDLTGNGLVPMTLNRQNYKSVYTYPDNTKNNSNFLNLNFAHYFNDDVSLTGNTYYKRMKTRTINGDINDAAMPEVPGGYGQTLGPLYNSLASQSNSCLSQAQTANEPGEKCPGILNRTTTIQDSIGLFAQMNVQNKLFGLSNSYVIGSGVERSKVRFSQTAEFADIIARQVLGYGYMADGTNGVIDDEPDDRRVQLSGKNFVWSVFATDTLNLTEKLSVTGSARYNHVKVENVDGLIASGPTSLSGTHTFSRVNPAIGMTYSVNDSMNLYGGYNEGSRAPTAIELGCANPDVPCRLPNSMAGDPPLKQVVTRTWEAGVRGKLGSNSRWSAGVFRSTNEDDIQFVAAGQSGSGYFKNFGETRRQGVEAAFSGKTDRLSYGINYTYLDATYQSNEVLSGNFNNSGQAVSEVARMGATYSTSTTSSYNRFTPTGRVIEVEKGDQIPLMPKNMLKAFAAYDLTDKLSLGGDAILISGQYARGNENNKHQAGTTTYDCTAAVASYIADATSGISGSENFNCYSTNTTGVFRGPGKIAGYAIFNIFTSYKIQPEWTLFARVNNVFDRQYATAGQLGADAFNSSGNIGLSSTNTTKSGTIGDTFVAPGAPRSAWIGIRWDFGGSKSSASND